MSINGDVMTDVDLSNDESLTADPAGTEVRSCRDSCRSRLKLPKRTNSTYSYLVAVILR